MTATRLFSRRELVAGAGVGGSFLLLATLPAPLQAAVKAIAANTDLTDEQRHTLRGLWDAVVPGNWEGVEEDGGAPGADQAGVQDWIDEVTGSLPWPLNWLTDAALALWAEDLDLWADVTHGWPFDGQPKFWELPLDPTVFGRGRQRKIILMQALFDTLIDVQYQAAIMLAKAAFFCDFKDVNQRVGLEYIGFPSPPVFGYFGLDFTFNRVLGDHDERLTTVNPPRNLVALPEQMP